MMNDELIEKAGLKNMVVPGMKYHSPLLPDLEPFYCYLKDSGHCILVVLAFLPGGSVEGSLTPASVKTVLKRGYFLKDGYVWCDIPCSPVYGLISDEEDDEYDDTAGVGEDLIGNGGALPEAADSLTSPPAGEPAWDEMLTSWISDFRKSQQGKYLIMCLAMVAKAVDYVYAPDVAYADTFSAVSVLFARAAERLAISYYRLPNMVFAAIAKRSDTDDEMKAVFLLPLRHVLAAAATGMPLPGIRHDYGISLLITASRNLDEAEQWQLRMLSEKVTFVPTLGNDGGNA